MTLKAWSLGGNPEKDDILSWSNLVYERSLQVNNVESDNVSQYFLQHWLLAATPEHATAISKVFDSAFSKYPLNVRIQILDTLFESDALDLSIFCDNVRPGSLLFKHLLDSDDLWKDMDTKMLTTIVKRQFCSESFDLVYSGYTNSLESRSSVKQLFRAIDVFKGSYERKQFFKDVIAPIIISSWALLYNGRTHLQSKELKVLLDGISTAWRIEPVSLVVSLLHELHPRSESLDELLKLTVDYAADVQAVLKGSVRIEDQKLLSYLAPSFNIPTVSDFLTLLYGANSVYLFRSFDTLEPDELSQEGLGLEFDFGSCENI